MVRLGSLLQSWSSLTSVGLHRPGHASIASSIPESSSVNSSAEDIRLSPPSLASPNNLHTHPSFKVVLHYCVHTQPQGGTALDANT